MRKLLSFLLLIAAPAFGTDVYGLGDTRGAGYTARANGMDWDDDFIYGESGEVAGTDDDLACDDADTDGEVIVAEDVDGDSELEQQIYVIPATGTDDADCGGPNAADACATVQYVLDNRMNADADADTEDIICLVGVSNEFIIVADQDGAAGTKTRTAVGDEVYDFQYPSNPNVIMGTDRDQDGEYPPYDTGDVSKFLGNSPVHHDYWLQINGDTNLSTNGSKRWEFAHLEVDYYGTDLANISSDNPQGSIRAAKPASDGGDGYTSDHMYYHDIDFYGTHQGGENLSSNHFLYWGWDHRLQYHALENNNYEDVCGYGMRGSGITGTKEYLRVRNTSATWLCDDDETMVVPASNGTIGLKLWGTYTYVEFLYNHWDGDISRFDPDNSTTWTGGGLSVNTCVRDFYAIGNLFENMKSCFITEGGSSAGCDERPGDNINFLRNECVWDSGIRSTNGNAISLGGDSDTIYHRNVTIANNIYRDAHPTNPQLNTCLLISSDSPSTGVDPAAYTFSFLNNTCNGLEWGHADTRAAINFQIVGQTGALCHTYDIRNNIITGGTETDFIIRWYTTNNCPDYTDLTMDYNIYPNLDIDREFWNRSGTRFDTLALFSADTGLEVHGKGDDQNMCAPTFVSASNLHLQTSDTCAQEAGVSAAATISDDIDGDSRPQGSLWDIGADEYESGYVPPPEPEGDSFIIEGVTVEGVTGDG